MPVGHRASASHMVIICLPHPCAPARRAPRHGPEIPLAVPGFRFSPRFRPARHRPGTATGMRCCSAHAMKHDARLPYAVSACAVLACCVHCGPAALCAAGAAGEGCAPVGTVWGWLCEYMAHECLKSSLAFRKPAVAAASRRPATRADGPKVGLDGPESFGAGRAPWRAGQARLPLRRMRKGNVCRGG